MENGATDWGTDELPAGWGSRVKAIKDPVAGLALSSDGELATHDARLRGEEIPGWENDNLGPIGQAIVNLTRLWTRTGPDAQDACALLQAVTGAMTA
jgi:hypothetical protein